MGRAGVAGRGWFFGGRGRGQLREAVPELATRWEVRAVDGRVSSPRFRGHRGALRLGATRLPSGVRRGTRAGWPGGALASGVRIAVVRLPGDWCAFARAPASQ